MPANPRNSRRLGQRGEALIEFALVLPFLLVLTFMVVDFSRAFMAKNVITQAAREGARVYAMPDSTEASAERAAQRVAAISGLTGAEVVCAQSTADVSVTVSADFNWLYPGLMSWLGVTGTESTLRFTCVMHKESSS